MLLVSCLAIAIICSHIGNCHERCHVNTSWACSVGQVQALVTAQQGRDMQLGCGMEASAVLPLPGLGSSLVPPQPLLDVHQ